jgi:hypothetical protein
LCLIVCLRNRNISRGDKSEKAIEIAGVINNIHLLLEADSVSHLLMVNVLDIPMALKLPLNFGTGIVYFVLLLLIVPSIDSLIHYRDVWALTRGTPYDDLLTRDTNNNNNNQTDLIGGTGAEGVYA